MADYAIRRPGMGLHAGIGFGPRVRPRARPVDPLSAVQVNPLDPLSFGVDLTGDTVDLVAPAPPSSSDCGCHDDPGIPRLRGKVLLGIALIGAAAYAYRHR